MSTIKKGVIVILLFIFGLVIAAITIADELGCCSNPGAGLLTCSADRLVLKDKECCPTPETDFSEYYVSDQNPENPSNSGNCANNFFFVNRACSGINACAIGCCCSELGGAIKPEAQCKGTGLIFHKDEADCNQICPIPQCDDNIDNDNNGCADFEGGDLGCSSPADRTELDGSCTSQGAGCINPNYTPELKDFEITAAKGQRKFLLIWKDECSENALSYEILRCKDGGCTNFALVGTTNTKSFEDASEDLLFDTTYTYQIKARYSPQTATPTITKTASLGNLECLDQPTANNFCINDFYYNKYKNYLLTNFPDKYSESFPDVVRREFGNNFNKAFSCNNFNRLAPVGASCPSDTLCIITNNRPACINKISCNYRSANPFGLYYTLQDCETNKYCFYDRSHSTINSCFSCEPSMSCYDYKTEEACTRDNCKVTNCRWKNLAGQIGIGVCVSTAEYNCKWCDKKGTESLENIKSFNEVFDLCTREKSNLLSWDTFKCYFRNGQSKNCEDVVCRDYSTDQCSNAKINHDENNKITNPSGDECGIMACQNIGGVCVKNADGDDNVDCESRECEIDYFGPNTTLLPIINKGVLHSLVIQIHDKTSINGLNGLKTSQDYVTFLCLEPCNSQGHPYEKSTSSKTIIISNLNAFDGDNGNKLLTLNDGTNVIRYYSQDPAKNLGEVKKIIVQAYSKTDGPRVLNIEITDGTKVLEKYFTSNQKPNINVRFVEPAIITFARLVNKETGYIETLQGNDMSNKNVSLTVERMLPNGEYTFELNAKNQDGIFMDQSFSATIVIDNIKPELTIAPSNGSVLNDSEIMIKLEFDKEVGLATATINSKDIKYLFSTNNNKLFTAVVNLTDGNKKLEISAKDFAKNEITGFVLFIVDANPTTISLASPRFGTASKYTFNIIIETDNNAECRHSLDDDFEFEFMEKFTNTGGVSHTIPNFNKIPDGDTKTHKLNVRCQNQQSSFRSFDINVDTSPPNLKSAFAYPNPVVEKPSTTALTIEVDEPVVCKFSNTSNDFDTMDGKFSGFDNETFRVINKQEITVKNEGNYLYFVSCKNKAELKSGTKEIPFKVDLKAPISIISHTPEFFNSTDVTLAVETNKKSQCKYSENDALIEDGTIFGVSGYSHTKKLVLIPGKHTFFVKCKDQYLEKFSDVMPVSFTIDITPPRLLSVDDNSTLSNNPDYTSSADSLRVKWESLEEESKLSSHLYSLVESGNPNEIVNWTTSYANKKWVVVTKSNGNSLGLTNGSRYFFRVQAKNVVGLFSDVKESDGITVDTSLEPASCSNEITDNGEIDTDCGGGCKLCGVGKKCGADSDCKTNFCNNELCTIPKCDDNVKNQEESDADCGGVCKKCQNNQNCNNHNDCKSEFCSYGTCRPQESCLDGILTSGESDIDCGGPCPTKCSEGNTCGVNEDCENSLKCFSYQCKRCEENDENCNGIPDIDEPQQGKDTDKDGLPDQWEVQNGLNPNEPNDAQLDSDNDGLTNIEEFNLMKIYGNSTDPNNPDTDNDGFTDKDEVDKNTNPTDPEDHPKSSFLKILLFAFGIVILLIGFGYLAYKAKTTKKEKFGLPKQKSLSKTITQQPPKQFSRAREDAINIRERLRKKSEQKKAEIAKLFKTFEIEKSHDEVNPPKVEKPESRETKLGEMGIHKNKQTKHKKPREDVFIRLKQIAKESKQKKAVKHKNAPK
ncbi:MAG: hypothetical protein AABX33_07970 [Nanoarchaeota archaeon]